MTNKNDNNKSLHLLLRHYGLSYPVEQNVQARMARDYDRIYKKVLKRTSRITFVAGIIAGIYFLIKKTALPVSFVKIGTAVLLSTAIGTGVYLSMKPPVDTAPVLDPSVIIRPFTTSSLDQKTGLLVARKLSESLNKISGEGYTGITTKTAIGGAPWSIFGTVEKINGKIIIIAKIIDTKTSRLLLIIEEECGSLEDVDKAINAIARQMPLLKKK